MGGAEATGAGSSQQKKRRVEEGDPLSAAKKSKRVLSKKGETTFDWSTVSVPVLRAFLCLIPDDKEHVMEAKAVLELTAMEREREHATGVGRRIEDGTETQGGGKLASTCTAYARMSAV